jgi:hypothetical protein
LSDSVRIAGGYDSLVVMSMLESEYAARTEDTCTPR